MTAVGVLLILPALAVFGGRLLSAANEGDDEDVLAVTVVAIVIWSFLGLVLMMLTWLYFALMESSVHQGTLGKMALGIRVTDMDGRRITFGRATGRYFAKIISDLTMSIGYIIAGFTQKKQALHDMVASCLVLNKEDI